VLTGKAFSLLTSSIRHCAGGGMFQAVGFGACRIGAAAVFAARVTR
jgi:hypothetical protein